MELKKKLAVTTTLLVLLTNWVIADEKTVTKTLTVSLDQESKVDASFQGVDEVFSLEPIKYTDGTRAFPGTELGEIKISATGVQSCEVMVDSDIKNENNHFVLAKTPTDMSDSLRYVINALTDYEGKPNSMRFGSSIYPIKGFYGLYYAQKMTIESQDGVCSIRWHDLYISSPDTIPISWTGTRTGNLIFTMRAE
ncbi:MAG: hypothetical protein R3F02_21980 [Thiolinea sp.]